MIDLFIELIAALIGRPFQRQRAKRLIIEGRAQCVLSYPIPRSALRESRMSGVAKFSPGSIELNGWRTHILSIELPGRKGFDLAKPDTRMFCGPPQSIYSVVTQRGSMELTLMRAHAPDVLRLLRVAPPSLLEEE